MNFPVGSGQELRMEDNMFRADPKIRLRFLLITFVVVLVGAALVYWGTPMFRQYLQNLYDTRQAGRLITVLRITELAMVLIFLGFLPFGIRTYRTGRRIARDKVFPLPGMWVLNDTPVVEGPAAVRRAVVYYILSILLVVMSVGGIVAVHLLLNRIVDIL
jgi:hypothetical protein